MNPDLDIHVIGGGIAGLTTALALRRHGFPVTLFEQSRQFSEVGAGITIGPNASRVLTALGLEAKLAPHVRVPRHAGIIDFKTGKHIAYAQRGDHYLNQFGAPFWHIHRADLLQALTETLADDPGVEFRMGHKITGVEQTADKVAASFANGATARCDVLIACDGIKSVLRETLFSNEPAAFTGYVAWRGLVETARLPEPELDPDFALYAGPGKLFGRYAVRNRSLVNYVAVATKKDWRGEGWSARAQVAEVAAEFADWCEEVRRIIAATPPARCFKWALHTREPLSRWVRGRVALLGDAAHPMMPFLGLGAGVGVEDGMVLARAFALRDDWRSALSCYEQARIEHAGRAQRESAEQGLHLLDKKPAGGGKQLYNDDALGLFSYDATQIPL